MSLTKKQTDVGKSSCRSVFVDNIGDLVPSVAVFWGQRIFLVGVEIMSEYSVTFAR